MIRIRFDRETLEVTARGHAGAGPKGADLVCAGVTALLLTLRENRGSGTAELREGYGYVRGDPSRRREFYALCRGFSLLARQYPRYLSYRERGDREKNQNVVD